MREETNYRSYRDWLKKQMIKEKQEKLINKAYKQNVLEKDNQRQA
jgi:hypothetical protein